jgi:TolB-like protein
MKKFLVIGFYMWATLGAAAARKTPTLSVLYFENLSTDEKYGHLHKAFAEMLAADLSKIKSITIIERENLEKITHELALNQSGLIDDANAPQAGKMLGADYIITGTILPSKRTTLITYKILQVESGKLMIGNTVEGQTSKFAKVEALLSASVMTALGSVLHDLAIKADTGRVEADTYSLDNIESFGKALDYKDKGDLQNAQSVLKTVLSETKNFTYGAVALSDVEKRLASYDKNRQNILDKEKELPITWASFQQLSTSYMSSSQFSNLLDLCQKARAKPPEAPQGSQITAKELIAFYFIMSYYSLKQWENTIKEGEPFMKNYPVSMYYSTVKLYVNQAMSDIKSTATRRDKTMDLVNPLLEKAKQGSDAEKQMAYFQIGQAFFDNAYYDEALDYYTKLKANVLSERYQIKPDVVLFSLFMCYYNLHRKKDAEKIYTTIESAFPQSEFLQSLSTLMSVFPE